MLQDAGRHRDTQLCCPLPDWGNTGRERLRAVGFASSHGAAPAFPNGCIGCLVPCSAGCWVSAGQLCCRTAVPAGWQHLHAPKRAALTGRRLRGDPSFPAKPCWEVGAGQGQEELCGFGHAPACAVLFSHTKMLGD